MRGQPQPETKPVIRDTQWRMPFGKYKGETIADLMLDDPNYLLWLSKNDILDLHADIIDEIEQGFLDAAFEAKTRKERAMGTRST